MWSQWWPIIINPWIDADGNHLGWSIRVGSGGCVLGICVSLACTSGRPWRVHRSRIRVVTDHILGAPVTPVPPPLPPADTDGSSSSSSSSYAIAGNSLTEAVMAIQDEPAPHHDIVSS